MKMWLKYYYIKNKTKYKNVIEVQKIWSRQHVIEEQKDVIKV